MATVIEMKYQEGESIFGGGKGVITWYPRKDAPSCSEPVVETNVQQDSNNSPVCSAEEALRALASLNSDPFNGKAD
jgi:hypothetical protein